MNRAILRKKNNGLHITMEKFLRKKWDSETWVLKDLQKMLCDSQLCISANKP